MHESHADHKQRHGQYERRQGATAQRAVAAVVLPLGRSGGMGRVDHQIVTGIAHPLPQGFGSNGLRIELHGDGRRGEVHRSVPNTGTAPKAPAHAGGAGGTTHAKHRENAFRIFVHDAFRLDRRQR